MDSATLQRRSITGMVEAGIDLGPERLVVGTRLDNVRVAIPTEVRIRDGALCWRIADDWGAGELASGALRAFARLAHEADDEPFAAFARCYGVLGALPDGRPGTAAHAFPPHTGTGADAWFTESLDHWRAYAAAAHATRVLAAALRGDARIDPWEVLYRVGFSPKQLRQSRFTETRDWSPDLPLLIANVDRELDYTSGGLKPRPLAHQRFWLGHYVAREWLGRAALTPDVMWEESIPRVTLALNRPYVQQGLTPWPENTLFSILAAQIAAALCSQRHLVICDCGEVFERKNAPRFDQPLRCPQCAAKQLRQQKRDWKRNYDAARRTPIPTPKPADDGEQQQTITGREPA